MPLRRVARASTAAILLAALVVTAFVLTSGASRRVSSPYSAHRTFVSVTLQRCVESTVRGILIGTRSGTGPLVRWSDIQLDDATVTAAGFELTAGRCDRTRPARLTAVLRQAWAVDGALVGSRRTAEGPATAALQQFNGGSPIRLPSRGFPASLLGSDYEATASVTVDARFAGASEGFGYPVAVRLRSR